MTRTTVCPPETLSHKLTDTRVTPDIWDNKVVPSFIDSKQHPLANLFFHHEDTAVYDGVTADDILY